MDLKEQHGKRITNLLLYGWTAIVIILCVAYAGERIVKGTISSGYLLIFAAFVIVPYLVVLIYMRMNPPIIKLKWSIIIGYLIMYAYVMMSAHTTLVFTYIFPMLYLVILYHDPRMVLTMGVPSLIVNVVSVMLWTSRGYYSTENSKEVEIQIAVLILNFLFSYLAARVYDSIDRQNREYNEVIKKQSEEQRDMVMQTITAIANTIDAKDEYTQGHSRRVAKYSAMLAKELGKSEEETDNIYYIALLHDIGKIGIPDSVLHKPGRLTAEEYDLIKQHPTIGANILKDIKSFPGLEIGAQYHHERYDGKGYPYGKAGEDIPEIARIVGVADTFDAMNSNRVYRKHFTKEYIIGELKAGSGTQFDPTVVGAMINIIESGKLDKETEGYSPKQEGRTAEAEALFAANKMLLDSLAGEHSERYLLEALSNEETVMRVTDDISRQLKTEQGILMLLEIDDIMTVTRQQGYLQMDYCLAAIAEALINRDDLLVCRMEGESFLIYRPGRVSNEGAREIVDAIRLEIKKNMSVKREYMDITFSIGVAVSQSNETTFHRMLSDAEKALYHVKQARRDSFYIYAKEYMDDVSASKKDLDALVAMVSEKRNQLGSFRISAGDYRRIEELIEHVGERGKRKIQIVLFTLVPNENADIRLADRQNATHLLGSAINVSIRPIDISSRFSSMQYVVLFLNLNDGSADDYINRITKEYYNMSPDLPFRLTHLREQTELK